MVYNPGQVARIFPYIAPTVEWFIIGGPADGDEAQAFHRHRPKVKVLGIEANPTLYTWQRNKHFPGTLLSAALWDTPGVTLELRTPPLTSSGEEQVQRCASVVHFNYEGNGTKVTATTLDLLDYLYGPFNNAFLWLDIEGAEERALKGAGRLLNRGGVVGLNIEVFEHRKEALENVLLPYGFLEAFRWDFHRNEDHHWWNAVYLLKGALV